MARQRLRCTLQNALHLIAMIYYDASSTSRQSLSLTVAVYSTPVALRSIEDTA